MPESVEDSGVDKSATSPVVLLRQQPRHEVPAAARRVASAPAGIMEPVTDSVWFWALLFSAAAFVSLCAGSNVYRTRQDRIEQRYQVRSALGYPSSVPGRPGAEADPALVEQVHVVPTRLVGRGPLFVLTLLATSGSAIMLYRERRTKPATKVGEPA